MGLLSEAERHQVVEGLLPRVGILEGMEQLQDERSEAELVTFLDWALRVPEPKTGTLNFEAFPFQPEMYSAIGDARNRQVVVTKSTQVGISAMTIRWALFEADRNGRTVLYVFPTSDDVFDFSDARISPLFDTEYLLERMGDPFNKGLKRVGVGLVYFRGSESKRKLDSVDADAIAFDEYDTLNQANIPDAERRLSGVLSAGLIRRIGVPSIPDFGIAEKFEESDRREWLVRCEACKHHGTDRQRGGHDLVVPKGKRGGWQGIDFWDNVREVKDARGRTQGQIVCAGCGEPLDVSKGRWVAQIPDAEVPGFHVSRLIVPNMRLGEIIATSKKRSPYEQTVFWNKDLGLPYAAKSARLSPEDISACTRKDVKLVSGYAGSNPVTMGVDVASERALNVRISEWIDADTRMALWIGEVEDGDDGTAFDQVALLVERYRVNMISIDSQPETRLARALLNRFPGRGYLCNIVGTAKQPLTVDQEMRSCTVVRTFLLDHLAENIRRQRNLLPEDLPPGYVQHLCSNIRHVEKDELDKVKVFWQKTNDDDYAMAEAIDLVAAEMYWLRVQIEGALAEKLRPIEDFMDVKRTGVADLEDRGYQPGPRREDPVSVWDGPEDEDDLAGAYSNTVD